MEANKLIIKSLIWAFLDQFSSKGISIIASIILARLLVPDDFGLISLVYIFSIIGQEVADGGLGASLIRTKNADYKDYSTIFFTNIFVAIFLYSICFIIAPYIAEFYDIPKLILLIRVYCLIFVINSFSSIHISILIKKMEYRKLLLLNLPAVLIGCLLAIYLAYKEFGVWSIVVMQMGTQFFLAIFLWIINREVKMYFSFEVLKKHYDFGIKIMLISVLTSGFKNITSSVIGKVYSVRDLGYYDRAKMYSTYPSTVFVGILTKVFYPYFVSIDNENNLRAGYEKVISISFYFSCFIMSLLILNSELIVKIILGVQWLPVVAYFKILCLISIIVPVNTFNLNILKVKGYSGLILKIELINILFLSIALIIGVYFNIIGLIYCLLFAEIIIFCHNGLSTQKYHKYTLIRQIRDFVPTILVTLFSYCIVNYIDTVLNIDFLLLKLLVISLLYLVIYLLLSFILKNSSFLFVYGVFCNKLKSFS
jgi:O-antigen/teichoic acid export membrane protein